MIEKRMKIKIMREKVIKQKEQNRKLKRSMKRKEE